MVKIKIFGSSRYQYIEDEFNTWASIENPFILSTNISVAPLPRSDDKGSVFFVLSVVYAPYSPKKKDEEEKEWEYDR